jgi:hypothetical protein
MGFRLSAATCTACTRLQVTATSTTHYYQHDTAPNAENADVCYAPGQTQNWLVLVSSPKKERKKFANNHRVYSVIRPLLYLLLHLSLVRLFPLLRHPYLSSFIFHLSPPLSAPRRCHAVLYMQRRCLVVQDWAEEERAWLAGLGDQGTHFHNYRSCARYARM